MKKLIRTLLTGLLLLSVISTAIAQQSGNFFVNGDLDKFYPVTFFDGGWANLAATELQIGRSDVHQDASNRGSLIASFRYHVTNWGHGSNFIDADIRQFTGANSKMISGWKDGTAANGSYRIIIWLRGNTTYTYRSNYAVNPLVYDGVQNPLPYKELIGTTSSIDHSYKTSLDPTVNIYGMSYANTAYFNGSANNYFAGKVGIGVTNPTFAFHSAAYNNTGVAAALLWGDRYGAAVGISDDTSSYYAFHVVSNVDSMGRGKAGGTKSLLYVRGDGNVGIGTLSPQAKLAVNGDIFSKRVKVIQTGWPDFVFRQDYLLPSLQQVEKYIIHNGHLPDIPAATEVEKDGLDLGEMNKKLLQKIEELTLYVIDQQKQLKSQQEQINLLREQNEAFTKRGKGKR
ncbi:hypothetical protein [uncultured Chitinophaga sp.]|uniref:hypothetical protein n=1 Tax=uncultured Chitinophaga sp. TaxID=339340 RepID=UPI00261DB961|nr:hypothetical protein [uncultured Chitinophaga sp.]